MKDVIFYGISNLLVCITISKTKFRIWCLTWAALINKMWIIKLSDQLSLAIHHMPAATWDDLSFYSSHEVIDGFGRFYNQTSCLWLKVVSICHIAVDVNSIYSDYYRWAFIVQTLNRNIAWDGHACIGKFVVNHLLRILSNFLLPQLWHVVR